MSLITLRSQINELSAESIDNSYIQNTFKEGLTVNPTDTVSLVSLSMNKQNKILNKVIKKINKSAKKVNKSAKKASEIVNKSINTGLKYYKGLRKYK